jgi:hypothetical protein
MSHAPCPDLLELAGDRYKITYDPAYDPFNVPRDKLDRWAMIVPCLYGEIFPWGAGKLAVFTRGKLAPRLLAVPGLTLWTDGDDGRTFTFPVAAFDEVAAIVQPRKRRRGNKTPEQMAEITRRGLEALARKRRDLAQSDKTAPGGVPGPPGDPGQGEAGK